MKTFLFVILLVLAAVYAKKAVAGDPTSYYNVRDSKTGRFTKKNFSGPGAYYKECTFSGPAPAVEPGLWINNMPCAYICDFVTQGAGQDLSGQGNGKGVYSVRRVEYDLWSNLTPNQGFVWMTGIGPVTGAKKGDWGKSTRIAVCYSSSKAPKPTLVTVGVKMYWMQSWRAKELGLE